MTPPEAGALDVGVLDVVVLAGGRGRRLGGVSKADVRLGRERLLDHILGDLATWDEPRVALGRVVVVAPDTVAVPSGVLRTLEDPPGGGPSAGIAAAVTTLGTGQLVGVRDRDARAAQALPLLLDSTWDPWRRGALRTASPSTQHLTKDLPLPGPSRGGSGRNTARATSQRDACSPPSR